MATKKKKPRKKMSALQRKYFGAKKKKAGGRKKGARKGSRKGAGSKTLAARVSKLEGRVTKVEHSTQAVHGGLLAVVNAVRTRAGLKSLGRIPGYTLPLGHSSARGGHALPASVRRG